MDEKEKIVDEQSPEEQPKEEKKAKEKVNKDKKIQELQALADDYKDKWLRNVAEFDNYKKRNAKLWQDAFNEGVSSVILKILPIGDSLDRALAMELDAKTQEGVKGIMRKFEETLSGLGVEAINPVGEPFDPNVAEAVMQVEGEGEESDTVKMVFEKGYRIKDKIIRYAKVSVVK